MPSFFGYTNYPKSV